MIAQVPGNSEPEHKAQSSEQLRVMKTISKLQLKIAGLELAPPQE